MKQSTNKMTYWHASEMNFMILLHCTFNGIYFPWWSENSYINDCADLLLFKYNSVQNTGTDNIQVLQYLITRSINICKDVILQYRNEYNMKILSWEARWSMVPQKKFPTNATNLKQIFDKVKCCRNGVYNYFIQCCAQPRRRAYIRARYTYRQIKRFLSIAVIPTWWKQLQSKVSL